MLYDGITIYTVLKSSPVGLLCKEILFRGAPGHYHR